MFDKHHKKENPTFTGITRGVGGFGFGVAAGGGDGGDGYSAADRDFFIVSLNKSNPPHTDDSDRGQDIAIGSDGSIYGSGDQGLVYKLNSSGVLQWQRKSVTTDQHGNVATPSFRGLALDSSDNVYVCNRYQQGVSHLLKFNSSGTYQWIRRLNHPGWPVNGKYAMPQDIAIDSNDNVFLLGYILNGISGPSYRFWIAKYDTSGNLAWVKIYAKDINQSIDAYGITTDSSGNIYVSGGGNQVNNYYNEPYVAKFNSSGVPQWYSSLTGPYSATYGNDHLRGAGMEVEVDSLGNVYLAGYGNRGQGPGTQNDGLLVKFNSNGDHQWHVFEGRAEATQGYGRFRDIVIDDAGKIHCVGSLRTAPNTIDAMALWKFDDSGTLLYRRLLRCHGLNDSNNNLGNRGESISIDSNRDLYLTGYIYNSIQDPTNGDDELQVVKLPSDGSLTGTYGGGDYIYENPTHTNLYTDKYTTATSVFTISKSNLVDITSNSTVQSQFTFESGSDPITNATQSASADALIAVKTNIQGGLSLPIEESGLDIYLDANNSNSYSGSGTTWTNLAPSSTYGNITLLTNGSNSTFTTGTPNYFTNLKGYLNTSISAGSPYFPFTYSVWIYVTSFNSYMVLLEQNYFHYSFEIHAGQIGSYSPNNYYVTSNLNANQWYNVTYTYEQISGTDNQKIYIDGSLFNQQISGSIGGTDTIDLDWSFGASEVDTGHSYAFVGRIAAFMVYNRALSATEITSNYNALKSTYGH